MSLQEVWECSTLPIVDLDNIHAPSDGLFIETPADCFRNFSADERCRLHYENIAAPKNDGKIFQCPFGFASMPISLGSRFVAMTGVIPYPRMGGAKERSQARRYPENKVTIGAISKAADVLRSLEMQLMDLERETIRNHAVALHEIRKLNRTVKQTAERLCQRQNETEPELADKDLVNIWKSAEIMSTQFDVLEFLANEELASLPLKSRIEIYRIFDKCARIYRPSNRPGRIQMLSNPIFDGRILACDKTFPIIPTVLIENALKYSPVDSDVKVKFSSARKRCKVEVVNGCRGRIQLDQRIFQKGVRGQSHVEGSGNGLYIAQLVARQHGAFIHVSTEVLGEDTLCTFSVDFAELQ